MAYVNLDPYAEPSWRTKIDTTNSPGVVPNTFAVYGYIPPGYIATLGPDNVGAVIGDPNNPNTWIYKGTLGDLMGGPPAGSNNGKASKNDAPRAKTVALSPSNSSQLEKLATVPDVIRYLTGNGAILNLGCSYYSSVKTNANIYRYEQVDANTIVNLLATSFLTKPDTYLGIKVSDVDSSKADIYMATGDITIQEDTSSTCDPDLYVFQSKPYAPPANNGAPLGNTGAPLANTGAPLANTGAPLDVVQQFLLENPNIGNLFAGITKIGCMPIPVPMADFQIPIDVINTEGLSPNLIQPGSYIGLNFNESTNTLEIKTQPLGSYAPEFNPLDDLITTLPMTQCSASTYTVYKNIPNGSTPSGGRVSRRAQKKRRSTKKNRKAKRMTRKMRKVRRSTKSRK
jgi:hypothetical protein